MKAEKKYKVLRLKKAMYGLKQAIRAWNTRIDNYFKKNDFRQYPFEYIIYVKAKNNELLFAALYVDDLIFMKNN
jgi:Reverse transcriptase (RNA-dependent DNA polymerase)